MTPQVKAKQLFMRNFEITVDDYCAKQCALIAVDEILSKDEKIIVSHKLSSYKTANDFNENFKHIQNELDSYVLFRYSYWQEVKHEITQL
jgi:methylphosphotriester-DNA--protein-cysteine methyltransferase